MRMSNKAKVRIATLINSIEVAHIMLRDGADMERWQNSIKQSAYALDEEFGIKLPALDSYRIADEIKAAA